MIKYGIVNVGDVYDYYHRGKLMNSFTIMSTQNKSNFHIKKEGYFEKLGDGGPKWCTVRGNNSFRYSDILYSKLVKDTLNGKLKRLKIGEPLTPNKFIKFGFI